MSTTRSTNLCDYEAGERIAEMLKRKFPVLVLESCKKEEEEEEEDDFIELTSARLLLTIHEEHKLVWKFKFQVSGETRENLFGENWVERLRSVLKNRN